jgi:hypothetical protein
VSKSDHIEQYPTEADIDEALKGSFPASDPPCWTLGIEQPGQPEEQGDSDSATAGRKS